MINQTTGQYTYRVPQQNNAGYYSSGYGTPGGINPYRQGGPKYVGSMLPSNNIGAVGGLLAETINVPRPGFNDTDGTPMHMSSALRPDGTNEHTSSFYFNQAQKPGQSVNEWKNMSPHEKAQIHENAARLAAEAGDTFSARRSMDVAERLRTGTPDWANPKGEYQGLGPWNYGDEGEYVAPGDEDFYIPPGDQRGPQWGELGEGLMKFIDPLGGFASSLFNANTTIPGLIETGIGYVDDTISSIFSPEERETPIVNVPPVTYREPVTRPTTNADVTMYSRSRGPVYDEPVINWGGR